MKYKKFFPIFIKELDKKLGRGFREYGDQSFDKPDSELRKEVEEELLDLCGWSFIRWVKLKENAKKNKNH